MTKDVCQKSLLLRLDLTFFSDKTEEPTAKKISDTRKKGSVARSQELSMAIELLVLFIALKAFGKWAVGKLLEIYRWSLSSALPDYINSERRIPTVASMSTLLSDVYKQMLVVMIPFMAAGFLSALLGTGLQFSFKVSTEPLKPKLDKFNPVNGFKRMFSKQALVNLLISIAKIAIIFFVAYSVIKGHLNEIFILYELDLMQAVSFVVNLVMDVGIRISVVYVILGFLDFFYQKRKFRNDIKMTKQEVKDEYKDTEGDPEIKGRQRQKMREVSQRRMMQQVPKADVVITNPTHIAVAIQYDSEHSEAPRVTAKGEELVAQRIKEVARENNVDIVENKPLARALYTTVDIGAEIPPELYQAVAEVLAVIYNKKHKRR
ncbi:MAG: flagellar biosynthesis protein FlhB [Lachnospiraceae bacterium]|nr:flagellar biosynthesis protein FlhB [Lachnospiraceae bacterium]MDD7664759.1 flagellar biosynthesis protein FlhB [Lachnospiraceae bacterium]MDY4164937.1 flagellar biosynthesis protein FlhB [Lachnospiraceae bacterium]